LLWTTGKGGSKEHVRTVKAYEAQGSSLEGSKEGRTPKCPRADNAVAEGNFRRGKDMNVHWQIGLLLRATFKGGDEDM
jgi:hypothetical protein